MITNLALQRAACRIRKYAVKSPIVANTFLDKQIEARIFLKCEQFQPIGAFKIRGAANFALQLSAKELNRGLVTHSSGNHAQAVAYIASKLGTKAWVVMPANANKVKIEKARRWGAEVVECEPTLESRVDTANAIARKMGATLMPPFDHPWIIEGQSSSAQELMAEEKDLDFVLAPLGGGGLLAGTALAARFISSKTAVIGCEPAQAADGYAGFKSGTRVVNATADTIADGLRTSVGEVPFEIIKRHVSDIWTVSEEEIRMMTRQFWSETRMIIEPSSAVPLAAMHHHRALLKGKRVGVILTGGNVDFSVPL